MTDSGARNWVLRISIGGKQREMGLGSFPSVPLAQAREIARAHRAKVAEGTDPISVRQAAVSAAAAERQTQQTFAQIAGKYIGRDLEDLRGARHRLPAGGRHQREFAILTAARSGEVRGARCSEIDLAAALWTVSAERMKAGREHRVPLSASAVELLRKLPKPETGSARFSYSVPPQARIKRLVIASSGEPSLRARSAPAQLCGAPHSGQPSASAAGGQVVDVRRLSKCGRGSSGRTCQTGPLVYDDPEAKGGDMWDGVTYVEPSRRPVIHEGTDAARLVVTNAGPGVVELFVWPSAPFDSPTGVSGPGIRMGMPPGNTRSVSGPMIGVGFADDQPENVRGLQFAAIAWRVVG